MADWNEPTNATVYTSVLTELKGRDTDSAYMFDPAVVSPTNVSDKTIRWNSVNSRFEIKNTTWGELDSLYDINVTTLDGSTASEFMRTNPPGNQTVTSGKLILDPDLSTPLDLKGGTTDAVFVQFYADAAAQSTRSGYLGYFGAAGEDFDIVNEFTNGDIKLTLNGSGIVDVTGGLTVSGDAIASVFNATGATSASDNSALGYTAANGANLTGDGSTNDIVLLNKSGAIALRIPAGTDDVVVEGNLSAASITGGASSAADESTDTTCFPLFALDATGVISFKTNIGLQFNSNIGELIVTGITADGSNLTGSASSFTAGGVVADAIDSAAIADNAIDSEHYVDGSIDRIHLVADIIDGTKIADDAINSEHYVNASIDQAHMAANSIAQTHLDDAVQGGTVRNTPFLCAGGQFALSANIDGDTGVSTHIYNGNPSAWDPGGLTAQWYWASTAATEDDWQLRYIATSPPYDLGDGEIPLFAYAVVDNATGEIRNLSTSPDPIWMYNGPTNTTPDGYKKDGTPYRMRRDMSAMPMSLAEAVKIGDAAIEDYTNAFFEAEMVEEEINQEIKNRDQHVIPHVFPPIAGHTLVLLDPVSDILVKLFELRNEHDDGIKEVNHIIKHRMKYDNSHLNRKGPNGILIPSFRWKHTK